MTEILIYLVVSFVISTILGKLCIPLLKKLKVGQHEREDGPRAHLRKQGTPTMGGIWIIITLIIVSLIYVLLNYKTQNVSSIIAVLCASIGFGIIGLMDDYKKVVLKNTDGISPKVKMLGLFIIALFYMIYLLKFGGFTSSIIIPIIKYELFMPVWFYAAFMIFVMLATTNAVNLTDGIDGLSGSVCTLITFALATIAYKYGNMELTIYSVIAVGAIFGFLIYNFYKAKVFVGDTGSLLMGGIISSVAIYLKQPLIIILLAIIPLVETVSVILQVIYFRKTGKRLFRMTPLHHHFELKGWRETKVVSVFSFITFIACIISILIV